MKKAWHYLRAFLIIWFCLWSGTAIEHRLGIAIPGCMIGMLILFAGLVSQLVPVNWVAPGCQLLTRFMPLLFVPISVSVMEHAEVLASQFKPIVFACLISTLLVLITTGLSTSWLQRGADKVRDKEAP